MKASELRIGNFVGRHGDNIPDLQLDKEHFVNILNHDWYLATLYPILLTEEWLLKFEFEKWPWCDDCAIIPLFFGDSLYVRFFSGQWHIKKLKVGRDKKGLYGKSQGKYIVPKGKISHVHQLQNLYFALTQKELTL